MLLRSALCILVLSSVVPAGAETILVTDPSGGTGGPACKLRDAITAANTDAATGGCPAGSGDDIIELPSDTLFLLTEVDNVATFGENGLPVVNSSIVINGHGSIVERGEGAERFRIFYVAAEGDLTLTELTVRNGHPLTSGQGGGILNVFGTLTIYDCAITGNFAGTDGGASGGGIYNTGTLTVEDSIVTANSASGCTADCGEGGGITTRIGEATLINSNVSGNFAFLNGGGIANNPGKLYILNSVVSWNLSFGAGGGGGIISGSTGTTIAESIICANNPDQIVGPWNDGGDNVIADACPCIVTDFNADGLVNAADLAQLLGSWGPYDGWGSCVGCSHDINYDGEVNAADLAILLGAWGPCG